MLQIFIPYVPVSHISDADQDSCLSNLHHRNRRIRLCLSSSRCSSTECSCRGEKDPCLGHGCHHYRCLRLCLRAVNNTVGLLGSQRVQRNRTPASTINGLSASTILLAEVAPIDGKAACSVMNREKGSVNESISIHCLFIRPVFIRMKHFALSDLSGCFLTKVMMAYYSLAANEWAVVVLLNFSLTPLCPREISKLLLCI